MAGVRESRVLATSRLPVGCYTCAPYFESRTNSTNESAENLMERRRFGGIRLIGFYSPRGSCRRLRGLAGSTREVLRLLKLPCEMIEVYANSLKFATTFGCSLRM